MKTIIELIAHHAVAAITLSSSEKLSLMSPRTVEAREKLDEARAALVERIEQLEKDAERYDYLTEYLVSYRTDLDDSIVDCASVEMLAAVIDEAMKGETP
jgi:hypothetical protein